MRRKAFVALALWLSLSVSVDRAAAGPGYCAIEIDNRGHQVAKVYVTFDDGSATHFTIHPHESPHHVSLFYYGHCHPDAHVRVELKNREIVYDSPTRVDSTILIVPHAK